MLPVSRTDVAPSTCAVLPEVSIGGLTRPCHGSVLPVGHHRSSLADRAVWTAATREQRRKPPPSMSSEPRFGDVAEGEAVVGVSEAEGAGGAALTEHAGAVRAGLDRAAGCGEADAPGRLHPEDLVEPVTLWGSYPVEQVRADQNATDVADQRGVERAMEWAEATPSMDGLPTWYVCGSLMAFPADGDAAVEATVGRVSGFARRRRSGRLGGRQAHLQGLGVGCDHVGGRAPPRGRGRSSQGPAGRCRPRRGTRSGYGR